MKKSGEDRAFHIVCGSPEPYQSGLPDTGLSRRPSGVTPMPAKKAKGKKGGKTGGKKKKAPAFYTDEEDMKPFGLNARDLVRTPLGITGTVLGVKYSDPNLKENGKLWVRYPGGSEHPLEPSLSSQQMGTLGLRKCSIAEHVMRDVNEVHRILAIDEERRMGISALSLANAKITRLGGTGPRSRPMTAL